ncbi:hypothetical protein SCUP515_11205 [Seiridium cupressi]
MVICHFVFALGLALPLGLASPRPVAQQARSTRARFTWGAIGDSWGSGVGYDILGRTDYDGNKDQCLRINHAYSVQVHQDQSWVPENKVQDFSFTACSGARLVNMGAEPFNGYIQMNEVGTQPDIVTMQAGGNDAGFYNVASSCIFHDNLRDYGPVWPNPDGDCVKAIDAVRSFVNDRTRKFTSDTVADILDHDSVKINPNFRLYVIGYAHFFNVDDGSTWCNDQTFSLFWNTQAQPQKLLLGLRRSINDLVEILNQQIQRAVDDFKDRGVGYIDITKRFDGGRFCETNHTLLDQYWGNNVMLWNASPEGVVLNINGNYSVRDPTENEMNNWLQTGKFTNGPNEVSAQSPVSGPIQGTSPGVALCPFHPKENGHGKVADAIIARLKADIGGEKSPPVCEVAYGQDIEACIAGCKRGK